MSLLSTSSTTNQEAFLYENHYPQPIVIEPNSQICLQKFIHYRGALYEVSTQNNVIGFRFGTGGQNQDVPRFAEIPIGTYEGADLATAITTALNSVNQQQNYVWLVNFIPAPSANDDDSFQIQYSSVQPTPDVNAGQYNSFDSGQLSITNQGGDNQTAKIEYNGTNADHFANVISKRSTLVYLGSQTWEMIQPHKTFEVFQPLTIGIVREQISNPNASNPNLQFNPALQDISVHFEGNTMKVNYGKQRQGTIVGNPNWFISEVRRDLSGLFSQLFKPAGTFSPHTKLQVILTIYASSQSSRRVLIQFAKKEQGETTYTPLANTYGNSPISGTPFVKSTLGYDGVVYDSNDPLLNDSGSKINQHFPQLSKAPFFPTCCFQKNGNLVSTGYDLDEDTWTNNAGGVISTFTALVANTNGYAYRVNTNVGNVLNNTFWFQIDPLTYHLKGGDVPLTDPPLYVATLDPTAGNVNPNGQIEVRDGITNNLIQTINFDGANPVQEETGKMDIFTQGIFNTIEPVAGIQADFDDEEATAGAAGGGLGATLNSNARLFLRGVGTPANVANLLGFSQNEPEFNNGGAGSGGSLDSDQAPDQTANNNTLHISIPEMPLVKSYEGENSAEAKSIAIIPREEFSTGDTEGSLVYVAPFENWIDINNGQELNMNLLTTIVRNADGSLADNLVRETQAVFKIRQDPMKMEQDLKEQRFKEMAEMMANTINTGLTALIKPQQLIGS